MTDEIEALKARRTELEREIESLQSTRAALYMPGITIVPERMTDKSAEAFAKGRK